MLNKPEAKDVTNSQLSFACRGPFTVYLVGEALLLLVEGHSATRHSVLTLSHKTFHLLLGNRQS